jgi:DNA repair protein RadA/Sms
MSKVKISFFCQSCGYEAPKFMGQCPSCHQWNSFVEEVVQKSSKNVVAFSTDSRSATPQLIQDVTKEHEERILSTDQEFNRVLGGGIVPGSIVLLGGDPGIGKSTLLLQLAITEPFVPNAVLFLMAPQAAPSVAALAGILNNRKWWLIHSCACSISTAICIADRHAIGSCGNIV